MKKIDSRTRSRATGEPKKTVFLDRDGVINRRIVGDWVTDWRGFHILEGVIPAIVSLHQHGYRTVVVTNQRGIATGRMNARQVNDIHRRLSRMLAARGGRLDEFYICPHDKDQGCLCRKPKPGLLDQADNQCPVDWSSSFLVGDSDTDILAGKARDLTTIKVAGASLVDPAFTVTDLPEAVVLITATPIP